MEINHTPTSSSHPDRVHSADGGWKKYALIAAIAMVVMAAGAMIGSGVTILYFGRMFIQHPTTPEQATRLITRRLSASADLSPEEQARTEALVEEQMSEVAEIRKKYEEEIAGRLGNISDGISEIIGPERASKCGGWMHRYRGRGNADQKQKQGKEEACGCDGSGAKCGKK